MDPLDREIAEAFAGKLPGEGPGRVLIVAQDDLRRESLASGLARRGHACTAVGAAEAQVAASSSSFDVVLLDMDGSGGLGLELAHALRQVSPATKTIVLFETRSFAQAVQALRCGVVDLINRRIEPQALAERIESAVAVSRADRLREARLAHLEVVCRRLAASRQEVAQRLDRLCEDLAAAYQDVSGQISEVAMATEFRTLLRQELDLEDLLRTALEYLLAKTGPTNGAVFLPDTAGSFDLGAYVNYDCPRDSITVLLNHLCRAVCPQMAEESEIVSFEDADEFARYIGVEAGFLAGCQVIAFACRHEARCLAVMVLFRSAREPFGEGLAGTLEILRGIFAEQVSQVIRIHHRANAPWPEDPLDDDEVDFLGL
jgi:DNA-binding response OmpR family regulator